MEISADALRKMVNEGVTSESHHATIKSKYREHTGEELDSESYPTAKEMLVEIENGNGDDAMVKARATVKERQESDEFPDYWNKVVDVSEVNEDGKPLRVIVACQDPHEDKDGNEVCVETREIAVQDLFQVERCEPCQDEYTRKYRAKKARERRQKKNNS